MSGSMSDPLQRARATAAAFPSLPASWWRSAADVPYRRGQRDRSRHVLLPLLPVDNPHSSRSNPRPRQMEVYLNVGGPRVTAILTPEQIADFFRFGSIQDFVEKRWQKSILLSSRVTIPPSPPPLGWAHENILNEFDAPDLGSDKASAFGGGGASGVAAWWHGGGSAVGAALAAVTALLSLLLVARLADRCTGHTLHNLFSSRRRQSEEWSTPNVTATNLTTQVPVQAPSDEGTLSAAALAPDGVTPPPPYWRCVEPPPPYSECFVTYSKDDHTPRIHLPKEVQLASSTRGGSIEDSGFTQTSTQSDNDLTHNQQGNAASDRPETLASTTRCFHYNNIV